MLRTGLGLSLTKYAQSLASASENMKKFLNNWDPTEVFITDAWKTLESDINARIVPKVFMKSLLERSVENRISIEGLEEIATGNMKLLYVAETRIQNKLFESMTEAQKIWTMANSGDTQTWTQMLPLALGQLPHKF